MTALRIVLVGHGMVGQRFLETLEVRADGRPLSVDVLAEETHAAYDRVQLTSYLAGATKEALTLWTDEFAARSGFRLHLGSEVVQVDRGARTVSTADGRRFDYDVLVLATGSYPFRPPIPGNDLPGCHVYRTLDDLDAIASDARGARVGAVIGGGLLGLEAAKALHDLGLETHVVEFAPRLMAVQLDDLGARLLRRKIAALGVTVHTGCATDAIDAGGDTRLRLTFRDGGSLATDLVVFSAGIRPQDALARACGLDVGERGGIVIDDACRTSDEHVFAVGECALWSGRIFGLVAPGYRMAEVAACAVLDGAAMDEATRFRGADMSTKLKLLGVEVGSIGDAQATTPDALECFVHDDVAGTYRKLVLSADRQRLLGAVLVGDTAEYAALLAYVRDGATLPSDPVSLIAPAGAGDAAPRKGVGALPMKATICTCNNVDRGALCAAIDEGHTSIGALKKCTRAGTSCGGCVPLVKQLLEHELAARGVGIDSRLCEHFAHSRQALFHLVRNDGLRSFTEVLQRHGQGFGCEVCKPAIASILASCWNEHVLAPTHASAQDTNDYFLANIQRNGTYSVVPRIPGGEITPAKLIAIGEIAQRFGLYTKITGGQRIDLFGARVEQLPAIWTQLIAAGFESGHAYGKALRTVKSCVGSTWCRFGVQDSVSMAITLEQRYRGVRSPHKLKLAVSGCTRECAEAQGKDVGVIASEKGWNLFVGGNGGARPRHAELLATDLDDATLVRYIDRFLMFYIRTADRLQRTSTWMENVEGGIDYVRRVVCDDALGIAGELEAAMQGLVDSYECEWKVAVETPAIRARFRQFVNSGAGDDRIRFVDERGQIRPAPVRSAGEVTA